MYYSDDDNQWHTNDETGEINGGYNFPPTHYQEVAPWPEPPTE